jgi:Holliday junction resolvase
MNETEFKYRVTKFMRTHGWLVIRLRSTDPTGIPDLICLRAGSVLFIETKTKTGVLSSIQTNMARVLNNAGFTVLVVSDLDELDQYMQNL